jgi:hypothetical protein
VVAGIGACGRSSAKHAAVNGPGGCRAAATTALQAMMHAKVSVAATRPDVGLVGCRYRVGPAVVRVAIDTNPQGFARFNRAVEKSDQKSLWFTTASEAPRVLNGVALGADWIPAIREMLASNGHNYMTINVTGRSPAAEALATAATRGTLRSGSAR